MIRTCIVQDNDNRACLHCNPIPRCIYIRLQQDMHKLETTTVYAEASTITNLVRKFLAYKTTKTFAL